ncbi:MAG: hypothetical protein V7L22_34685 [Nostoc sp.]
MPLPSAVNQPHTHVWQRFHVYKCGIRLWSSDRVRSLLLFWAF